MSPEDKLLPLLRGVVADGNGKWKACCPCHNGGNEQSPSLGITKADDGKLLMHCFVCGDGVKAAEFCMAVGLTQSDLYPERLEDNQKNGKGKKGGGGRPKNARKTAEFFYRDEQNVILYRTDRYEWDLPDGRRNKEFEQRRPNGEGGFVPGVQGVRKVLYRLPELLAADQAAIVFIVEGEKKVEALRNWGMVATCIAGGAKSKWNKEFSVSLSGRNVVILPDNDPINQEDGSCPGKEFAVRVLKELTATVASVRIIELPGLPPKGDIVDWQVAGHTAAELLKIIGEPSADATVAVTEKLEMAKQEAVDPISTHFEDELLVNLQLDVLGELEGTNGSVKVFSESRRKSDVLKEVGKMTFERLLQVCGPIVKSKVTKGVEAVDGMYSMSAVRSAISLVSGSRRITDDTEVGVGCWSGMSDDLKETDSIVIVGAGEAAKWNGTKILERVTKPRIGGRLLDMGSSESWYDFATLADLMQKAGDRMWAFEACMEAECLFEKWNWKSDQAPALITGLVLATWIQTIWAWRPLVAIIGRSNSGKTTLIEALAGIFGKLAIKSSRSTAAGIRQTVQRSAAIVMVDEFEASKQREETLEMFRASSRGDKVLRGTAGHKGKEFTLRHIAWVAAIESGLKREPDRNRFITLEALPPNEGMQGKLVLPPSHQLSDMGMKLLAVAIRYGLEARQLAVSLKSHRIKGIHARAIESYAVPAAIRAALTGLDRSGAIEVMERLIDVVDREDASEGDEEALMNDILSSTMRADHGVQMTVIARHWGCGTGTTTHTRPCSGMAWT